MRKRSSKRKLKEMKEGIKHEMKNGREELRRRWKDLIRLFHSEHPRRYLTREPFTDRSQKHRNTPIWITLYSHHSLYREVGSEGGGGVGGGWVGEARAGTPSPNPDHIILYDNQPQPIMII